MLKTLLKLLDKKNVKFNSGNETVGQTLQYQSTRLCHAVRDAANPFASLSTGGCLCLATGQCSMKPQKKKQRSFRNAVLALHGRSMTSMFQGWCNLIRYRILHKHIRQYSRTHKRNAFLLEGAHSTSFSASNCSVTSQRIHTQTRQPHNPQGELDARVWIFRTGFHDPDFQQQAKHFRSSHSMKHALHEALDRLRQMTTVHDPGHNALLVQFC